MRHLLLSREACEAEGISFFHTNRGGDITYHGPGQVVVYPILDLDNFFTDVHRYVRSLEEVIISTLRTFGVSAFRREGLTGVWTCTQSPRKIAAIGIRISRWVTMHWFGTQRKHRFVLFSSYYGVWHRPSGHHFPCAGTGTTSPYHFGGRDGVRGGIGCSAGHASFS